MQVREEGHRLTVGGEGAHVCRLDTHACLSIHRVGVASRRQANITVVSLGLDSRQL